MKILSFNSQFEADMHRSCAAREPSEADLVAIRAADAVVLPRGCKQSLYLMARRNCPHVFPNYDVYYRYPGKTGQIRLFRKNNLLYPYSKIFNDCGDFFEIHRGSPLPLPCVFKFSWGGEGRYVYLLKTHGDFLNCMRMAEYWEKKGLKGFLFQEYVSSGGRSLRAVVMGKHIITYWRKQKDSEQFYTNLTKGAVIDSDSEEHLQDRARRVTRKFSKKTGLNLAGLDFLFSTEEKDPEPLFLEINYFFRCTGLGGPDNYRKLLKVAITDWINDIDMAEGKK
jgi:ribosomal protein S6--L-glutamate ligase